MQKRAAVSWIVDSVGVFVVAAALIWPAFWLDYSDKWSSIEATFISDARFLRDHWPHPQWQPNWYTGTRFDYVYPPALRYGTAALSKLIPSMSTARTYHIYVSFMYCLGIAGVYLLSRAGGGSRLFSIFAALAVATIAPTFLFIDELRRDARASYSETQRLGALFRYGEGPHMSAVAMLGLALACAIPALKRGTYGWIALSAVFSALVVSNNFYGATALAMLFPILLWSWWITHQNHWMFLRAAIIAALAYGLCAFWLVPTYLTVTLANMRFVSEGGNRWSLWVTVVLAIAYLKLTERWARDRKDRAWHVFLVGAVIFFIVNVIGNYYLQFRVIGEPTRMVPELDMLFLLAACEILRRIWDAREGSKWRMPRRAVALLLVFLSFYSVRKYITHSWLIFADGGDPKQRIEYQVTEWMARNMPDARAYTSGSVRFWYNAWFDLAELGGGSEQGLLNPIVQPATYHIGASDDPVTDIAWMQVTGVDAAIIHDERSREEYHDAVHPKKFEGRLEAVFDNGAGDYIYKVPRRYPGLARVVDAVALENLPLLPYDPNAQQLQALADLLERGPEAPVSTEWVSTEHLRIRAKVGEGHTVFVQVAHNKPWHAYTASGERLKVHRTHLNFMRIEAPPGDQTIDLVFETPVENIVGRVVTVGTLGLLGLMVVRRRRTI